jgi:hypothetical protein
VYVIKRGGSSGSSWCALRFIDLKEDDDSIDGPSGELDWKTWEGGDAATSVGDVALCLSLRLESLLILSSGSRGSLFEGEAIDLCALYVTGVRGVDEKDDSASELVEEDGPPSADSTVDSR